MSPRTGFATHVETRCTSFLELISPTYRSRPPIVNETSVPPDADRMDGWLAAAALKNPAGVNQICCFRSGAAPKTAFGSRGTKAAAPRGLPGAGGPGGSGLAPGAGPYGTSQANIPLTASMW